MIAATRRAFASRDLFVTLVERHLRLRLKRSWMGIVWPTVFPFLLGVLYLYVFRRVLDVPIPHYWDYVMCGLIPWSFFQQSLTRGMASVSTEPEIIAKAPFPQSLLPISAVVTHAINLVFAMGIFIVYLAAVGRLDLATLPAVALPLLCVVLVAMSVTILLALLDVYNQDLRHALPVILTIWFFVVPIVYRWRRVPEVVRDILTPEPMHLVVAHVRSVLYRGELPPIDQVATLVVVSVASFFLALAVFQRWSVRLAEDI